MTTPLYYSIPHIPQTTALLLRIEDSSFGTGFIFDQTIFHPQGGGQPGDQGWITIENILYTIHDTRKLPTGEIIHLTHNTISSHASNIQCTLAIDEDTRALYSRLHAAGHIIDIAISMLKLPLLSSKAYHFPDHPYVEYSGSIIPTEELRMHIDRICAELIQENFSIESSLSPAGIRSIHYKNHISSCGGTHPTSSGVLGSMYITQIRSKKESTKISYSLS